MNKREFNKILNSCSKKVKKKKILDTNKIAALSDEVKEQLMYFIVRARVPLVQELVLKEHIQWLASCGYYHWSKSESGFVFLHTCEHEIK